MHSVAAFTCFDLPEIRETLDAWWAGLARHCRQAGIEDVPNKLLRPIDERRVWEHPAVLLGQLDGYRCVHVYGDRLRVLATPCYKARGCVGPRFRCLVLVREDDSAQVWTELQSRKVGVEGLDLLGSWRLFKAWVEAVSDPASFFGRVIISGGALDSLALLHSEAVDYVLVDCVTYALIERERPEALQGVRIIAETETGLAPPIVTSRLQPPERVHKLGRALIAALTDPEIAPIRKRLLISAIEVPGEDAYEDEPHPVESTVTLLSEAREIRDGN
ncbi:MAG: PhnD/SsuA/transferrin family substrate-binding protein [Geminicoccaceae bacterium]